MIKPIKKDRSVCIIRKKMQILSATEIWLKMAYCLLDSELILNLIQGKNSYTL